MLQPLLAPMQLDCHRGSLTFSSQSFEFSCAWKQYRRRCSFVANRLPQTSFSSKGDVSLLLDLSPLPRRTESFPPHLKHPGAVLDVVSLSVVFDGQYERLPQTKLPALHHLRLMYHLKEPLKGVSL